MSILTILLFDHCEFYFLEDAISRHNFTECFPLPCCFSLSFLLFISTSLSKIMFV